MGNIDSGQDYLDVRDIIARVEELREARLERNGDEWESGQDNPWAVENPEDDEELTTLAALLEELKGNGGDEQWEGDWYPVTLIRDSYFETAMDELLDDIGDMPKDLPSYLRITVDYTALQQDYSSVEFDGIDYWYR